MKKIVLNILFSILLIFLCHNKLLGQNLDSIHLPSQEKKLYMFSTELFFHLPYYFIYSSETLYPNERIRFKNYWNYGGGILISQNMNNKFKVSSGVYLSTKNYKRKEDDIQLIDKINYLNIPVFISYNYGKFNPYIGFIYNRPYYFNNKNEIIDNVLPIHCSPGGLISKSHIYLNNGPSFRFGCDYKIKKNQLLNFHIKLFCDYKLFNDVSILSNHFMIGIDIGIEFYLFKFTTL